MHFSVFSPKQVIFQKNSSANAFMIKWSSELDKLWKAIGIFQAHYILKYLCYAQHLHISLYNGNDL